MNPIREKIGKIGEWLGSKVAALRPIIDYILLFGIKNIIISAFIITILVMTFLPWAFTFEVENKTRININFLYAITWPGIWLYLISLLFILIDHLYEIYIRKRMGFRALGLFELISLREKVKEEELGGLEKFIKKLIYDNFYVSSIVLALTLALLVIFNKLRIGGYMWANGLAIVLLIVSMYAGFVKKDKDLAKKFLILATFFFYLTYVMYLYEIYHKTGANLRTTDFMTVVTILTVLLIFIL